MKIETLNIWGGRVHDELMQHVNRQADEIDVFCFQEVYDTPTDRIFTRDKNEGTGDPMWKSAFTPRANNYKELQTILSRFQGIYYAAQENYDHHGPVDYPLFFGIAMFVRENIKIVQEGEVFIFLHRNSIVGTDNTTLARNLQYVQVEHNGELITIANAHGLWNGKGKTDSKDRIDQSKKIKKLLDAKEGQKILCGDFNILPGTESLAILEEGMLNLIQEYGITSTRSNFYAKPEKFADYILVSPDIRVSDFNVLQESVSDHLPLVVEIE